MKTDVYKDKFDLEDIENWIIMVPLTIILGIIMIWCFYFRFMKAYESRKKLIWVEVLSQEDKSVPISRY